MSDFIPAALRTRLGGERADRLAELLLIERELRRVYEMDARDHDPGVGDNANLFGQKIWHHVWFALEHALEDWPEVRITSEDNSYRIRIWKLTIAVYKVGDDADDSIESVNFNGSATKKADALRNQLQLFSFEEVAPPEEESAFLANDLWVAHFGNPRDQLVKLYIGAPCLDEYEHRRWAWYRRIDHGGPGGGDGTREPVAPTPFDEQPEAELELELEADVEEAPGFGGE